MKRFACLCGGLAVLVAAQSATAQVVTTNSGLTIWYDVRPTVDEITVTPPVAPFNEGQSLRTAIFGKGNFIENVAAGNAGGPGDAQVLRISPRLPQVTAAGGGFGVHVTGNAKKGFVDNSVANLYVYITVEASGAGTEQVISALGRDTDVLKLGGANGNKIESILVTPDTGQWSPGGTSPSPSAVAAQVAEDFFMSAKSVKIPVVVGPLYDATGGAIPTGVYRVACIRVTADKWNKNNANPADSRYEGRDEVNNLLMTRAVKTGGPAPVELPDFGYFTVNVGDVELPLDGIDDFVTGSNGGTPEASNANDITAGAFTGVDIGASSTVADFEIIVQMKGDFNDDGTVTGADVVLHNNAVLAGASIRQRGVWLGDFTNEGAVTGADVVPFNNTVLAAVRNCTLLPLQDCVGSGLPAPPCPAP